MGMWANGNVGRWELREDGGCEEMGVVGRWEVKGRWGLWEEREHDTGEVIGVVRKGRNGSGVGRW